MFTQNPITGADERVIEASWGLGEVVVAGLVIPDHFRLDRDGAVLECTPGARASRSAHAPRRRHRRGGGRRGRSSSALSRRRAAGAPSRLATRCEEVYGPARDIEWAFADGQLYLLQCRAVTRAGSIGPAPRSPEPPPEVVTQVPFFAGLDEDEVHEISHRFKERRFPMGETITKEGAGAAAFFVIDSGEVVVTVHGREVARLGRGDYFGEVALIDEGARTATITAATDVVCFGLTYWEFRPLVQQRTSDRLKYFRRIGQDAARRRDCAARRSTLKGQGLTPAEPRPDDAVVLQPRVLRPAVHRYHGGRQHGRTAPSPSGAKPHIAGDRACA